MPLLSLKVPNEYPKYLYHKEHDTPIRVDSKDEETPLLNQGWVARYLMKEYPMWDTHYYGALLLC